MRSDDVMTNIRRPAVAGQFYPVSPAALHAAVTEAYASPLGPGAVPVVAQNRLSRVFGIVVPHAGYQYSGPGAAWAFAELAHDGRPAAAILLGVNHHGLGAPVALSPAQGWATPLGIVPVAGDLSVRLMELDADVVLDERAHRLEHSLEVQVPFLQTLYGTLDILPILLGQVTPSLLDRLGVAISRLTEEFDLIIVASTDFSHYIPHREAEVLDHLALQQIAAISPAGLLDIVQRKGITMCGVYPVAVLLTAARAVGASSARVLHYHTSGDVTGDRQEVVGYGAAVVYR